MLQKMPATTRLTHGPTRRQMLLALAGTVAAGCSHSQKDAATQPITAPAAAKTSGEPIIDIHQHTNYWGRSDRALLHHQQRMGVSQTILLPSGSPVNTESTLKGRANGLYAGAGTMDTCIPIAIAHPHIYYFGSNEVPDLPEAHQRIETGLKMGAVVIGEQKFDLPVDSPAMEVVYSLAQEYNVPVLMHFQYETFNTGYERLGKVLAKWPRVIFVGHAVMFWANIDAALANPGAGYPKGPVKPGGLTDRYLSDHANFYGDLSAGSGLNALVRDEQHARGFLDRHQNKLMFGSDCADSAGFGPTCTGANIISAVRRLAPSKQVERKLLYGNAAHLYRLT